MPAGQSRVARVQSFSTDHSDGSKRVSFNKSVHVKRIPRGAAVLDNSGRVVAVLGGRTLPQKTRELSPEEITREAQDILRQVDQITCATSDKPFRSKTPTNHSSTLDTRRRTDKSPSPYRPATLDRSIVRQDSNTSSNRYGSKSSGMDSKTKLKSLLGIKLGKSKKQSPTQGRSMESLLAEQQRGRSFPEQRRRYGSESRDSSSSREYSNSQNRLYPVKSEPGLLHESQAYGRQYTRVQRTPSSKSRDGVLRSRENLNRSRDELNRSRDRLNYRQQYEQTGRQQIQYSNTGASRYDLHSYKYLPEKMKDYPRYDEYKPVAPPPVQQRPILPRRPPPSYVHPPSVVPMSLNQTEDSNAELYREEPQIQRVQNLVARFNNEANKANQTTFSIQRKEPVSMFRNDGIHTHNNNQPFSYSNSTNIGLKSPGEVSCIQRGGGQYRQQYNTSYERCSNTLQKDEQSRYWRDEVRQRSGSTDRDILDGPTLSSKYDSGYHQETKPVTLFVSQNSSSRQAEIENVRRDDNVVRLTINSQVPPSPPPRRRSPSPIRRTLPLPDRSPTLYHKMKMFEEYGFNRQMDTDDHTDADLFSTHLVKEAAHVDSGYDSRNKDQTPPHDSDENTKKQQRRYNRSHSGSNVSDHLETSKVIRDKRKEISRLGVPKRKTNITFEDKPTRSDSDIEQLRGFVEYRGPNVKSKPQIREANKVKIEIKGQRPRKPRQQSPFLSSRQEREEAKLKRRDSTNQKKLEDEKEIIHAIRSPRSTVVSNRNGIIEYSSAPHSRDSSGDRLYRKNAERFVNKYQDTSLSPERGTKSLDRRVSRKPSFLEKVAKKFSSSSDGSYTNSPAVRTATDSREPRRYRSTNRLVRRSQSSVSHVTKPRRVQQLSSGSAPSSESEGGSRTSASASSRSVFLHAPVNVDIPPAPSINSIDKEDRKSRAVTRSLSMLAPWRPRHYGQTKEIDYTEFNSRPPRPPRKPVSRVQSMPKDARYTGWMKRKQQASRENLQHI